MSEKPAHRGKRRRRSPNCLASLAKRCTSGRRISKPHPDLDTVLTKPKMTSKGGDGQQAPEADATGSWGQFSCGGRRPARGVERGAEDWLDLRLLPCPSPKPRPAAADGRAV